MKPKESKDVGRLFVEGTAIDDAIARAVRQAILRHKREQRPIVIYRDGAIVWIQPDDIELEATR